MFSQILKSYRSSRITKVDKDFAKTLDFKEINFPVKIRDIHKIEPKNSIDISVFGYENKEKQPNYVSKKCCEERQKKNIMFLSMISIDLRMIIHYIASRKKTISLLSSTCFHYRRNFRTSY